eukprot:TRINITY_DN54427_c0_g1_i1.p1 TRINITY_DN54427_c0_g1~~TRINITY_DN54427_c0_g1_i1.p1  ORF type:complete len:346 (+),score=68.19 TRINITY_DN54427_c0_g1_i1:36-1040(+)
MVIQVCLKCSPLEKEFDGVVVDPTCTVFEVKEQFAELSGVAAECQRLIYNGQVLVDGALLQEYGPQDGHSIYLVKGKPLPRPRAPPGGTVERERPTAVRAPEANAPAAPPAPAPTPAPPSGDLLDSLFSNPQVMQDLLAAMPGFREITERNPEMAAALQDPQLMRQAMRAMRNPAVMQEMQRNSDRMLNTLDVTPGGFNALQRMYHEVQRPMEEAQANALRPQLTQSTPVRTPTLPTTLNSEPLPNPWARRAGGFSGFPFVPPVNTATGANTAATGSTPPVAPPEVPNLQATYQEQLSELESMGFTDRQANLRALQIANGNLMLALEHLLQTKL